jgi:ACS family tartrate transporter-like MFS transporter
MDGAATAGSIALINSIGNLGGFCGPWVVGVVKESTHSFKGGLAALAIAMAGAGALALLLPAVSRKFPGRGDA